MTTNNEIEFKQILSESAYNDIKINISKKHHLSNKQITI